MQFPEPNLEVKLWGYIATVGWDGFTINGAEIKTCTRIPPSQRTQRGYEKIEL
jgi:hypothetical protein